jgi:tetratricopeptide (TPR) repeat protein
MFAAGCATSTGRPGALTGVDGARAVVGTRAAVGAAADAAQALAWKRTSARTRDLEDWVFARYLERSSWSALGGQRALVARGPEDARQWFNLGVLHEDLGRLADARDAYSRAAALGEADASLNLLGVCGELGDEACVKEHFDGLRERAASSPRDALRFARALHWTGSSDAKEAYEAAAELAGEVDRVASCNAHAGLARVALSQGNYVVAKKNAWDAMLSLKSGPVDLLGDGPFRYIAEPVQEREYDLDVWKWARYIHGFENFEIPGGASFSEVSPCSAWLLVELVAYFVPLQDQPFHFPIKRLVQELKLRGEAEQELEKVLFGSMTLHTKHAALDLTTPHAAVLIADLYYDFGKALVGLPMPDGLTPKQQENYKNQIDEYATPLIRKSVEAYGRAFELEEKHGTGHPAFVRARERMLEVAPELAPPSYTPGSLVRRAERRVPWKKLAGE